MITSNNPLRFMNNPHLNVLWQHSSTELPFVYSSSSSSSSCLRCSLKNSPFNRSKFDRVIKDPPLIQKAENEVADYCSTLEGDAGYSCWRAYFQLKDLQIETPREDIERLILQAGGTKSLIGCLHGIAGMKNGRKQIKEAEAEKVLNCNNIATKPCPVPDGLPKSREEMEEEEEARMPDSPFTRLLRTKGRSPAWYSQAPDHA